MAKSEEKIVEIVDNKNNDNPKKKKIKIPWKYILNIAIVLTVTGVAVLITVFTSLDSIVSAFSNVDWKYILVCLGMEFASITCYALILFCFARLYTRNYKFHQAYANDSIGRFWSGVTPGATGGQIMQAYTYKKQGLPISNAASILIMYSMCYQFVLILYGVISLIFKIDTLYAIQVIKIEIGGSALEIPVIPLVIIGFILNLGFIGLLVLMSYSEKFHNFILGPCISFFSKIKLLKNPDKKREDLRVQVENFKIELRRLLSNVPFLILVIILFFIAMTFCFGVPYFAARALGCSTVSSNPADAFITSVFYSNFHQMVTGLIPIPGSAGVSEYFFWLLFKDFFALPGGGDAAAAGQLIWRTITFTLPLLIGGFVAAFYKSSPKEETNDRPASRDTFVSIQHETYAEREKSANEAYSTSPLSRSLIMSKIAGYEEGHKPKQKASSKTKKNKKKKEDKSNWEEITVDEDHKED